MIVSCVAALSAYLTPVVPVQKAFSEIVVNHCTYDTVKQKSWIEISWKFNSKEFSGTSGRTTVNHFMDKCAVPSSKVNTYMDNLSAPLSVKESAFVLIGRTGLKNNLRFFISQFCSSLNKK
jgi:hypothetical protein